MISSNEFVAEVIRFLEEHEIMEHTEEADFRQFVGGASNEVYELSNKESSYILRRPPPGSLLPTAHDLRREVSFLRSLQDTMVPVPRVKVASWDFGEDRTGDFYIMERVDGYVIRETLPAVLDAHADRRRISLLLVETLAAIHNVDYKDREVAKYASKTPFIIRQLRRWQDQMSRTAEIVGKNEQLEAIGRWLTDQAPQESRRAIVHGDYKLNNVVIQQGPDGPSLAAVLDWEMGTIGDPLADLAWLTSRWGVWGGSSEFEPEPNKVSKLSGFLSREELIETYQNLTDWPTHDIDYFEVFALWKLAIIGEGVYARHLKNPESSVRRRTRSVSDVLAVIEDKVNRL